MFSKIQNGLLLRAEACAKKVGQASVQDIESVSGLVVYCPFERVEQEHQVS